jgi:hypothetical protein
LSNSLQGLRIGGTFRRFLQVPPEGVDGTLRNVCDGEGDVLPFRLSTSAAQFTGPLTCAALDAGQTSVARLFMSPGAATDQFNVAGLTAGPDTQKINVNVRMFGTLSAINTLYRYPTPVTVRFTDAMLCAKSVASTVSGMDIAHVVSPAAVTGEQAIRHAFSTNIRPTTMVGTTGYMAFVSNFAGALSTVNMGGPGGWDGNSNPDGFFRGSIFGYNSNVWLDGEATNWGTVTAAEFNVSLKGNATARRRAGIMIVEQEGVRAAVGEDGAILIMREAAAFGHTNGIVFGAQTASFPVRPEGAVIKVQQRLWGASSDQRTRPATAFGIDFTMLDASVAAFASPGFALSGTGGLVFTPPTSATLTDNNTVTFVRVSNTQLRIDMRGTDGVTRSNTLTLT